MWLNPPFSSIAPWARKCAEEAKLGAEILLLAPASVGANWWWSWVEPAARVYSVGRMTFDNCFNRKTGEPVTDPYPKDLALCHFKRWGHRPERMERWIWQ